MRKRCFTNILSADVNRGARFYEKFLGMRRHYNSDWFVLLIHNEMPGLELGLLKCDHDMVPDGLCGPPGGIVLTFVVDDCDRLHELATEMSVEVLEAPRDMPYGQRRMMLRDPDGTVLDISAPVPQMS